MNTTTAHREARWAVVRARREERRARKASIMAAHRALTARGAAALGR